MNKRPNILYILQQNLKRFKMLHTHPSWRSQSNPTPISQPKLLTNLLLKLLFIHLPKLLHSLSKPINLFSQHLNILIFRNFLQIRLVHSQLRLLLFYLILPKLKCRIQFFPNIIHLIQFRRKSRWKNFNSRRKQLLTITRNILYQRTSLFYTHFQISRIFH